MNLICSDLRYCHISPLAITIHPLKHFMFTKINKFKNYVKNINPYQNPISFDQKV